MSGEEGVLMVGEMDEESLECSEQGLVGTGDPALGLEEEGRDAGPRDKGRRMV